MRLPCLPLIPVGPSPIPLSPRRGNEIGAEGGAALANELQHVPQLRTLDLSCARAVRRARVGSVGTLRCVPRA
jgi:hypothetical protein